MSDLDKGGRDEIRSFEAKVSVSGSCGACGGLAAKVEVGGRDVEGFEDVEDVCDRMEKGFALLELDVGLVAPKSVDPRSLRRFCGSRLGDVFSLCVRVAPSVSSFLTSLKARMLPGFLQHCFLLQVKMCNLLSSFGKYSGKSPLSCRRSDIALLQTLHLAKDAKGVLVGSSQACFGCQRH